MPAKKVVKPAPKRHAHWLNQREMAKSCGISVQAFQAWGVESAATIGTEVFYTVDDVIENRLARQAARQRAAEPEGPADEDLDREKLRLTREQRIGQELKNAQTRRELAPIAVIEWTLGKVGAQIAAILESIPLKVKKVLPAMTATEIEHLKREVVKAQNAAARVTVDLDEYYDGDGIADRQGDKPRSADSPST